ncbi:MAG: methyl-accepting chemotaxis protein [Pseudomonadota bacterium]
MVETFDLETLWQNDPIVRLEKALTPIVQTATFLALDAFANHDPQPTDTLHHAIRVAILEIEDVQVGPMARMNITLDRGEKRIADDLISKLSRVKRDLPDQISADEGLILCDTLRETLVPQISVTLDTFRNRFIDTVITRQMQSDAAAERAQKEIETISKKIFFVSINASVEASRFGEQGSSFVVISNEIRNLAQQAQTSLRQLLSA